MMRCEKCFSTDLVELYSEGQIVCDECGVVQSTMIPESSQSYVENVGSVFDTKSHWSVGNPLIDSDAVGTITTTTIGRHKRGVNKEVLGTIQKRMHTTENSRAKSRYRVYNKEFKGRLQNMNFVKSIIDEAFLLWQKLTDNGQVYRCKTRLGIQAACLWIACKNEKVTRTIDEITKLYNIKRRHFNIGYRELDKHVLNNISSNNSSTKTGEMLSRMCQQVVPKWNEDPLLRKKIRTSALSMVNAIPSEICLRSTPKVIAATVISLVVPKEHVDGDACVVSSVAKNLGVASTSVYRLRKILKTLMEGES